MYKFQYFGLSLIETWFLQPVKYKIIITKIQLWNNQQKILKIIDYYMNIESNNKYHIL